MRTNTKRVFYVDHVADPIYEELLAARNDVRLDRLENGSHPAEIEPVVSAAHAYQIGSSRDELGLRFHADSDLLARAPNLLIVSTNGAGYDTVNVEACTQAGVLVVNQAGGNREAVAEHVLAMLLCLTKRIIEADRAVRRDPGIERMRFTGNDAYGKTIGVIGIGYTGSRVAELCRGLLAMKVLACDPYLSAEEIAARGAEKVDLDTLLRGSDFVSVNCPLTAETRGMIGAREYALMRPGSYFITCARGFIHDEQALLEALRSRSIAGAGLDVWSKEPPPRDHPLLAFDNVIVSPHTAGVTREARNNMGRIAAEQLLAALDGQRPPRIVNPQVWPAYAQRFERVFGFAPAG